MSANVLSVDHAVKRFDEVEALRGASLDLHAGECLALLGPNGAGKTTLVRSLTGRVQLDAGTITLAGQELSSPSNARIARRCLGTVPQEIALYASLSVSENLRTFGALNGLRGDRLVTRIAWALDWAELASRSHDRVEELSGGMQRRLNLACSVLHEPTVLLLDEPTAGIDPQSRERIWAMLRELQADGAAVLLTTHQLDEAQRAANRIVILDHGETIAVGTFDELLGQTVGSHKCLTIKLQAEPAVELLRIGFETVENNTITYKMTDVGKELPELLATVVRRGGEIKDVTLRSPSLQDVFIGLTGRELRE